MQITEEMYTRMPPHLQALFIKDANPGRAEVVEAFPTLGKASGVGRALRERGKRPGGFGNVGHDSGDDAPNAAVYSDEGSAARFFYSAKASKSDRAGSRHPTVKPVSLMSWLVKLITPPGGVVLDPFAGSGTTGQAALQNGFKCLLVEREAEYVADICRRLLGSPPPWVGPPRFAPLPPPPWVGPVNAST